MQNKKFFPVKVGSFLMHNCNRLTVLYKGCNTPLSRHYMKKILYWQNMYQHHMGDTDSSQFPADMSQLSNRCIDRLICFEIGISLHYNRHTHCMDLP